MTNQGKTAAIRKPRADAERNRAHLLETAKAVFAEKGAAASLDEIARRAGVGAGTLYRHFSSRDALITAVYRNEVDQLIAAADRLAEAGSPVAALREWLLLVVDYIAAKHGMYELFNSIDGGASCLYSSSSSEIRQAIVTLAGRAVASGDIRMEIDPLDLLRALAGVANTASGAAGEQAARHLVDIMIAGMRTHSASP